jgi:hypothetical protein
MNREQVAKTLGVTSLTVGTLGLVLGVIAGNLASLVGLALMVILAFISSIWILVAHRRKRSGLER